METASLSEIKKELKLLSPTQLQEIAVRLAKHKKENKELLSYLLFDAFNQQVFIQNVKDEIDESFKKLHSFSTYHTKKQLRKILRETNKYIRFSGSKEVEIELRIYFCMKMRKQGHKINYSRVIANMYMNQVKRIKKALSMLHEDLQYDYQDALDLL